MSSLIEYRRRSIIPLTAVVLASYFLFVFMPLGRRAQQLDEPLQRSWKTLTTTLGQTNTNWIDFTHITNQLNQTREALALLKLARQKASARLQLTDSLRDQVAAPFRLVDYQNERSKQFDTLFKLAKQQGVTLDPGVLPGLPEHTADITQPELLWAGLSMVSGVLTTALQCKVAAIHTLNVPFSLTNTPIFGPGLLTVDELPFEVEFTGPAENVARLLQALPLRGEEMAAAGLGPPPPDKGPVFIDRLVLRKQSPEKPDEVRVFLRATGFVLRE